MMNDFAPDDLATAAAFYGAITDPTTRALLDFLIDHPDQRFDGAALVGHLGLARHADVARAAYALGGIAAGLGRKRPWSEGQLGYQMPSARAALFARVRRGLRTED